MKLTAATQPPLITSPRAVKRLTNSYGLFTALQHNPAGGNVD
jgi:hypothetical protein